MKRRSLKRFGHIGVWLTLALAGCGGKESECRTLIGSMRALGRKLAVAQSVTSRENAEAQRVAIALRNFAREATSTGETLAESSFRVPNLKRIAGEASGAAFSLADSATKMVEVAERLRGQDPARHAASIQRTLADVAAANLRRLCASNLSDCTALSTVLLERPPFPDASVDPAGAAAWTEKATRWIAELTAVDVTNPELKHQIANLGQTSRAFATALTSLAAGNDSAKALTVATKAFSSNVATISAAMTEAQEFCKN
ncbi:MAG TPA: hypothetical protein VIV60_36425 [Polyangiaceae bacterium]